jgi:hypothetical protein
MLALELPRRYAKAVLSCRATAEVSVSCKVVKRSLIVATGAHAAVMRLPQSFDTVRISCTTRTKLACIVKRLS